MNKYFHIVLDLKSRKFQDEIMDVIASLELKGICMDFNSFPSTGYFMSLPANLLVFSEECSGGDLLKYKNKYRKLNPEINFIYLGKRFYFHEKLEILEIPFKSYDKFFVRCLLNLYLDFNKTPINRTSQERQIG